MGKYAVVKVVMLVAHEEAASAGDALRKARDREFRADWNEVRELEPVITQALDMGVVAEEYRGWSNAATGYMWDYINDDAEFLFECRQRAINESTDLAAAAKIRELVEPHVPLGLGFFTSVARAAMHDVDWWEIARSLRA